MLSQKSSIHFNSLSLSLTEQNETEPKSCWKIAAVDPYEAHWD